MADPLPAYDDPAALAHRLIDLLTATTLRIGLLRRQQQEHFGTPMVIEEKLALIEQELMSTAELAQLLRATLTQAEEAHDDSGAWSGEAYSGR